MTDLHHYIGDDLSTSATGDLRLTEDDSKEGEQRVLRRLLTNSADQDAQGNTNAIGDYLWHQIYGAGLGKKIGDTTDIPGIRALIRKQIFNEAVVSRSPDPVITVVEIDKGVSVSIKYTDSITGKPVTLAFDVNQ